ncbi:hypothetical protein Tco_0013326 [Tanacetum coccineum]
MMVYLKNMANYKMKYFKGMSYHQIRPIFEEEYRKVQTLFKKDSEVSKSKKKRVAEEALLQESFKKLRTAQASGSEPFHQEKSTEEPKELSKEDLKNMLEIVPVEEFRVAALRTKNPIIDWEIHIEGSRKYWKIIRVGNITEAYQGFEDMLKPTKDMEKALWVELKKLYEPDKEDALWKLQRYMHDPLTWRFYGSCAVHYVFSTRGHYIYMFPEKGYPLTTEVMMLMLSRRLQVEEDSISPAPKPFVQEDPSVNRIYGSGISSSTSIRVSEDSSSGRSTMKSANICPLTDTLASLFVIRTALTVSFAAVK